MYIYLLNIRAEALLVNIELLQQNIQNVKFAMQREWHPLNKMQKMR